MIDMPYSVNLSGGGLDQEYLNQFVPGWNITVGIEPTYPFKERAGMATSTRNTAIEMWGDLPDKLYARSKDFTPEKLARLLFEKENHGKEYISGFQDSIGICGRGITACWYDSSFMPKRIIQIGDEDTCNWLEENINLFEVGERDKEFKLDRWADCNRYSAQRLADASEKIYHAIERMDLRELGRGFNETRKAYQSVFPESMPEHARQIVENLKIECYGVKPNGAGGGGYLITAGKVKGGIPIKIRR